MLGVDRFSEYVTSECATKVPAKVLALRFHYLTIYDLTSSNFRETIKLLNGLSPTTARNKQNTVA